MRTQLKNRGFSLIEMMIVVAIIAISVTIAMPAYTSYTTRAKVTELIWAASPYKTSISEYAATMGKLPQPNRRTGFGVVRDASIMIERIKLRLPQETVIFVEVRPSENVSGEIRRIQPVVLRGQLQQNMQIKWDCGIYNRNRRQIPMKYMPSSCRNVILYNGRI